MTSRSLRRAITATALVAVAATAAALYASPYWTLHSLATAVQEQDANTVAEHVNFPALREDLKGQLLLKMQREMAAHPSAESQPFSGLGQVFAMGIANQMVDNLVSPAGVALALKNGAVLRSIAKGIPAVGSQTPQDTESGHGTPGSQPQSKNPQRDFTLRYQNWSTVQVQTQDGSGGGFTLRRDGLLSWKLAAMDLSVLQGQRRLKRQTLAAGVCLPCPALHSQFVWLAPHPDPNLHTRTPHPEATQSRREKKQSIQSSAQTGNVLTAVDLIAKTAIFLVARAVSSARLEGDERHAQQRYGHTGHVPD